MPALLPPSMQIGALMPGNAPFQVNGPAYAPGAPVAKPAAVVQTVISASTGAAQPASASVTIAASGVGTTLLAGIVGNAQGGTQNTPVPTNFTSFNGTQGQTGNVYACAFGFLSNNVGGITTVSWPTLTNWSSYVAVVWEVTNLPVPLAVQVSSQGVATSATGFGPSAVTSFLTNAVAFGIVGDNSAQALTIANTPAALWNNTAVQTSTNTQASVVNTNAYASWILGSSAAQVAWQIRGTAGVATQGGGCWVVMGTLASGTAAMEPNLGINVDNLGAVAQGGTGGIGFALGGTKPGGAGGGQ